MQFFEVFKAGDYPQGTFSQNDIETLAKNYDPSFCEAPVTLDHEQKGPAYGWVSELKAENGRLKASFRDISGELKEFVQSGKYRKISVEIYRELEGKKPYLKAVSFLGAAIPQVKGMDPVEFKEAPSDTYVFEAETNTNESERIVKLQNRIKEIENEIEIFKEEQQTSELISKLQEQIKLISKQIIKIQENLSSSQKNEEDVNKLKQQIQKTEFEQFLSEQISNGKLTPVQKDLGLKIFAALDNIKHFDENQTYLEDLKKFIESLPKQVEFKEIATKDKKSDSSAEVDEFADASEESKELYKQALELAKKENIEFKDALLKIQE